MNAPLAETREKWKPVPGKGMGGDNDHSEPRPHQCRWKSRAREPSSPDRNRSLKASSRGAA